MPSKTDLRESLPIRHYTESSVAELFQNKTLRPILKLQNDLYIAIFREFTAKHATDLSHFTVEGKRIFAETALLKDIALKNLFIGMTIGMFTMKEMQIYLEDSKMYNKRIMSMLAERIISHS